MATVPDLSGNNPYVDSRINSPVRTAVGASLVDGVTAPATAAGKASIYVDSADGDLKVKFADGTTKVIAADT